MLIKIFFGKVLFKNRELQNMKNKTRIHSGKGGPGYRTPSVFRYQKHQQIGKLKSSFNYNNIKNKNRNGKFF